MKNVSRASNIELLRIVAMLFIIAHHYVVNSGITDYSLQPGNAMTINSIFCLVFGSCGKIGLNCFILITGYFMCKSNISIKKFLKTFLEIEFYNIVIYLIFLLTGYSAFSAKDLIRSVIPFYFLGTSFIASYLVFFLFIPYLNILIRQMNEKLHLRLVILCLAVNTILQTFLKIPNAFTYVGLFISLYFIASYIRLYPKSIFENNKKIGIGLMASLLISWASVVAGTWIYSISGRALYYYFVSDSNKLLAIVTSVFALLFFKNLKIKNSRFINIMASATFGVLLIHANSLTMRQWLWQDIFKNMEAFQHQYFIVHAVLAVIVVYIICTVIDILRIKFIEKPFFLYYENKGLDNKIRSRLKKAENLIYSYEKKQKA